MGGCYTQIESQKCYKPENPIGRVVQGLRGDSEDGSNLEVKTQPLSLIQVRRSFAAGGTD